jgi:hypothetical protein
VWLPYWNQRKSPCFSTIGNVPINKKFLEWWRMLNKNSGLLWIRVYSLFPKTKKYCLNERPTQRVPHQSQSGALHTMAVSQVDKGFLDSSNFIGGEWKFGLHIRYQRPMNKSPPKCLHGSTFWKFWCQKFVLVEENLSVIFMKTQTLVERTKIFF